MVSLAPRELRSRERGPGSQLGGHSTGTGPSSLEPFVPLGPVAVLEPELGAGDGHPELALRIRLVVKPVERRPKIVVFGCEPVGGLALEIDPRVARTGLRPVEEVHGVASCCLLVGILVRKKLEP